MSLPLEDLFNDVLSKAQRGLGLSNDALAERTGVSAAQVAAAKEGATDAGVLLKLAPALGLHGPALLAMMNGDWHPEDVAVEGLEQFNTPYHDMTVNAYLVWDLASKEAAAFDTGATAQPMVDAIAAKGLTLRYLFLTHTHPDHVNDIASLKAPEVLVSQREPHASARSFAPGTTWKLGKLEIEARSTWGHSKGGTTFVVIGLAQQVAVVGDALFASSMGGGIVSYADALATNRKEIFSLPDQTILCPGHGPLTTVAEEKAHNPFFPEFK